MKKEDLKEGQTYFQTITPSILEQLLTKKIYRGSNFGDILEVMAKLDKIADTEFACDISCLFDPGEKPLSGITFTFNQGNRQSVFHNTTYYHAEHIKTEILALHTHEYYLLPSGKDLSCAHHATYIKKTNGVLIYNPSLRITVAPVSAKYIGFLVIQQKKRVLKKKKLEEYGQALFEIINSKKKNILAQAYSYITILENSGMFKAEVIFSDRRKKQLRKKDIKKIAEKFAYKIRVQKPIKKTHPLL